jgi:hypothetical protein
LKIATQKWIKRRALHNGAHCCAHNANNRIKRRGLPPRRCNIRIRRGSTSSSWSGLSTQRKWSTQINHTTARGCVLIDSRNAFQIWNLPAPGVRIRVGGEPCYFVSKYFIWREREREAQQHEKLARRRRRRASAPGCIINDLLWMCLDSDVLF